MLTIDHLYFSYTGKEPWLLEDISLQVPEGSYISIVGNNGSGKSTLLKLILGFLHSAKGTIRMNARRIGYVPQMPGRDQAFPITVREVIHSYGKLLHLNSFSVKETLAATGMEDFEDVLMGACQADSTSGCSSPGPSWEIRTFSSWTSLPQGWTS